MLSLPYSRNSGVLVFLQTLYTTGCYTQSEFHVRPVLSMGVSEFISVVRSSVGIATDYGLNGPGSNPGGDGFCARPYRPWSPPSLLYNGYQFFAGGKERLGRAADHSPPSSAAVMEE